MNTYGLRTRAVDGRVRLDPSMSVLSLLGFLDIGGVDTPQSGSVLDERLTWGLPFYQLNNGGFNTTRENYTPTVSFAGNQLTWSYPSADGSVAYKRPQVRLLYGIH